MDKHLMEVQQEVETLTGKLSELKKEVRKFPTFGHLLFNREQVI